MRSDQWKLLWFTDILSFESDAGSAAVFNSVSNKSNKYGNCIIEKGKNDKCKLVNEADLHQVYVIRWCLIQATKVIELISQDTLS